MSIAALTFSTRWSPSTVTVMSRAALGQPRAWNASDAHHRYPPVCSSHQPDHRVGGIFQPIDDVIDRLQSTFGRPTPQRGLCFAAAIQIISQQNAAHPKIARDKRDGDSFWSMLWHG